MTTPVAAAAPLQLRGFAETTRSADFVASTACIDSFDEVVEQSWRLDRYLENPVVLYGHDSKELPIGRAENVRVVDGRLECSIVFASAAANPKAEQVWQLVKEKALRAVSVGFVPGAVRLEKRGAQEVYVLSDNTLHEISVVPIPANREALAKMRARAMTAAVGSTETTMADENKALETKDRELAEARKSLDVERAKLEVSEVRGKMLEAANDVAVARALAAEAKLVERDLGLLVGVKIAPAEMPSLIKLAQKSPEDFEEYLVAIKARPDMHLLSAVMPEKTEAPAVASAQLNGQALADRLEKMA